ncbi:MAG: mevalonate kinase [Myxococcota bacterium]
MAYGRGKLILLGEHGVVYGRPALAASVARGVTATARPADGDRLEVRPWGVSVSPDAPSEAPLARAFRAALDLYEGESRPPLHVDAEVALPGGAGLGCSAALGVAVIGAIDERLGRPRAPAALAEAAMAWERVFHGNPSGIDAAMAAGQAGIAVYRRGEPLEPVVPRTPPCLVVGHSGEPGSTAAMVAEVARQHARAPERMEQIFDAMASLVRNGRIALEAGDVRSLGRLMDLNQALLSSVLVSTSRLEELCVAARQAGALGAKLTGGGGGGCMIALVENESAAEPVLEALRKLDADPFVADTRGP